MVIGDAGERFVWKFVKVKVSFVTLIKAERQSQIKFIFKL